jgi:hypothetical protein
MKYFRPKWRAAIYLCTVSLTLALAQSPTKPSPAKPASENLPPLPADATQYAREAFQHQLEADHTDHTHWRYRIHREDDKGSQDRDVIETKDGELARTLFINGQPLTSEQRVDDEERMKKLVEDANDRAKREKRLKEDHDKGDQMLKAIPDAFIFKYDGAEDGQIRLSFFPNPHYNAPTRETQVFRSMSGKLWIDRAGGRLSRMDGALFEDVTFGWGLLGRLNKGGTFSVTQNRVGENHWEIVGLDVRMTGKAVIFKSINVKQMQRLSDFRRVSDELTIAEAYQMLEKGEHPVSAENQTELPKPSKE